MAKTASKPRQKPAPKEEAPQPILQARVPIYGEHVRRSGSDMEYEITYVSPDGGSVHIGIPRTNFEHRNVAVSALIFLEEPANPSETRQARLRHRSYRGAPCGRAACECAKTVGPDRHPQEIPPHQAHPGGGARGTRFPLPRQRTPLAGRGLEGREAAGAMISYTFSAGSAPALPNAESHCRAADRAVGGRLTDALHIAKENWYTPEQLRVISDLRVR